MMNQDPHGECRMSLLDRRGDQRRTAARWCGATAIVRAVDRAAQQEWALRAFPPASLMRRVSRRGEGHATLLAVIRRITASSRLWRERARSRPQLRELNDHLLRDIGLRRDDVGYDFRKPFWCCD
jgi:uncharacterized protein YjiS (DUF1127 family)